MAAVKAAIELGGSRGWCIISTPFANGPAGRYLGSGQGQLAYLRLADLSRADLRLAWKLIDLRKPLESCRGIAS